MPKCIDCGKELKCFTSFRCKSCAAKIRMPRSSEYVMNCKGCGKPSADKRGRGFRGERGLCRNCAAPFVGQKRRRRVKVTCPNCDKVFEIKRYLIQINEKSFCEKECYNEWLAKNVVGDKVHNWKGGRLPYYGPNWRAQRKEARIRANNKCEHCGKTREENKAAMDVHHIKPFREFGYIQEQNDNYLEANHLSNLVALCKKCHRDIESGRIAIEGHSL